MVCREAGYQAALESLYEEEAAISDDDGEALLDNDGYPVLGRTAKFPVH